MPRPMPRFDLELSSHVQLATRIVQAGETVRATTGLIGRTEWTIARIESLYELAYLRIFAAWEMCQESVFFRSLCGYASTAGQETISPGVVPSGQYFPSIAAAEQAVMGNGFLLWHKPSHVINRCRGHFAAGAGCPRLQETVISSHQARLLELGAIRHRIVHVHQTDAQNKFDAATVSIAGRTYPASRAGRFLRDEDNSSPPIKWLNVLASELVGLARQIV